MYFVGWDATGPTGLQRTILAELLNDRGISFRELVKKLRFSPPTIAMNLRGMEASGAIRKFTAQLDFKKMAFLLRAIVSAFPARTSRLVSAAR